MHTVFYPATTRFACVAQFKGRMLPIILPNSHRRANCVELRSIHSQVNWGSDTFRAAPFNAFRRIKCLEIRLARVRESASESSSADINPLVSHKEDDLVLCEWRERRSQVVADWIMCECSLQLAFQTSSFQYAIEFGGGRANQANFEPRLFNF